jgi:hypothetical protein
MSRIPPRKHKPIPRFDKKFTRGVTTILQNHNKTKLLRGMDLVADMDRRRSELIAAQDWAGLLLLAEEYRQHGAANEATRIINMIPENIIKGE